MASKYAGNSSGFAFAFRNFSVKGLDGLPDFVTSTAAFRDSENGRLGRSALLRDACLAPALRRQIGKHLCDGHKGYQCDL
jgi:hypothetical protein